MHLSKIGEFGMIRLISRAPKNKNAILGIGDDAAVFKSEKGHYAVTTDMIVEGDHFSLDYFSPKDIGIKAMESNVSDIAAMGAKPLYAFVSIALKKDATVELVRGLYRGIYQSAKKHGIDVMGGDTTHGATMVVNITLIGIISDKRQAVKRSGAKVGDLIFVTGKLGASTAGLKLFQQKIAGHMFVKGKHCRPSSRMDLSGKIAKIANAMEDVSDGLASEVRNICIASRKGAVIIANRVPIGSRTRKAAKAAGNSALDYALFGGEDFELVFTVPQKFQKRAEKLGTHVGFITSERGKIFLEEKGKKALLKKFGYDHFV